MIITNTFPMLHTPLPSNMQTLKQVHCLMKHRKSLPSCQMIKDLNSLEKLTRDSFATRQGPYFYVVSKNLRRSICLFYKRLPKSSCLHQTENPSFERYSVNGEFLKYTLPLRLNATKGVNSASLERTNLSKHKKLFLSPHPNWCNKLR